MATDQAETDPYDKLVDRIERISYLTDAAGVLGWDQQVTMPDGGAPARGKQLSALSGITHELLTDEAVGDWLGELEDEDLEAERAAVVREVSRRYERETSVPEDLVEAHTELSSEANQIWQDAKADSDWGGFAGTLDELKELRIERAQHIDPDAPAYETMYESSMPTLPLETVETVFADLKEGLIPLIEDIQTNGGSSPDRSRARRSRRTNRRVSTRRPRTSWATTGSAAGWIPRPTHSPRGRSSTPESRPATRRVTRSTA
jgi:carboxypeptidase Taq